MLNKFTDHKNPDLNLYGIYRAVVKDRDDPLQAGRVKVKVYPMFKDFDDDALPWAIPGDPLMGGFADVGSLFLPEVEAHVYVFFENGDPRYPVYFCGAPALSGGVPDQPKEGREGYPYKKVYKTRQGITFEIDDTPGSETVKVTHPSGYTSTITEEGSSEEVVVKDKTVSVSGNYQLTINGNGNIMVSGDADIEAGGETTIKGNKVNLN